MSDLNVLIAGAGGRMGQALIRAVDEISGVTLAAAIDREGAPAVGQDAGTLAGCAKPSGVIIGENADEAFAKADAVIDFTGPAATVHYARLAAERGLIHVIGTTGFTDDDEAALEDAAKGATIIKSGNMSLGVNLLANLVRQAARALDDAFDIEVLEMHHKHKVDAPSGTALLLGHAAAEGREIPLHDNSVRTRDGVTGPRETGSIGFATLRGGSVVGTHSVIFAGEGERIELSHIAEDRAIFSRGAVKAALWGSGKPPGLYSMADVLGLSDT